MARPTAPLFRNRRDCEEMLAVGAQDKKGVSEIHAIRSIGLDVHPTTVYVTILSPAEDRLEHYEFPMETGALEAFLATLRPGDRVALEATGNTWYLHRRLKEVVEDVVVAESTKLKRLLGGGHKTDRNDSSSIAYLAYIGGLPTVWVPDEQTQQAREFLQHRAGLVKEQTRYKNRIRALLTKHGLSCSASDLQSRDAQLFLTRAKSKLPWASRERLASLLEQLETVSKSLERADAVAVSMAAAHPQTELLATIPGIDDLLAITILACIGDVHRFPTPGSLANYTGMVPAVHSSGRKKRHGGITKRGNRMLRWAVTQAVQSLKNVPGPFRNLYRRLGRRGDKQGRAVVACGRKLLVVIWHMLTKGETFRGGDPEKLARKKARRQARRPGARAKLSDSKMRHHQAVVGNLALLRELALRKESSASIPEQLRPHLQGAARADQLLRLRTETAPT